GRVQGGRLDPDRRRPWGGSITFDPTEDWYFGIGTPAAGKVDFLSFAVHELGHLIGMFRADSAKALMSNGSFTGQAAEARLTINFFLIARRRVPRLQSALLCCPGRSVRDQGGNMRSPRLPASQTRDLGQTLEGFREYLRLLARLQLDRHLA